MAHTPRQGPEPGDLEIAAESSIYLSEKQQQQQHYRPSPDDPITYLYLDFDSTLPRVPTPAEAGLPDDAALPPCPSLKAYENPLTWPLARKGLVLALSCIATFLTAYTAGSYAPPSQAIANDLGVSKLAVMVGITTFCMGFAFAPMALAPLSEFWGRYPVFVLAGVVFVVFQIVCPVVTNLAGLLVARFLAGVGGSVFSSVVGGVLADMWLKEDRNTPMALFSGFVLAGTGAGPLVSAAFMQAVHDKDTAWKWTFWHQVILDGILLVAIVFLFRESRGSVLLTRKAKVLNKWLVALEEAGVPGVWVVDGENVVTPSPSSTEKTLPLDDATVENVEGRGQQPQPRARLRRVRWVVQADEGRASMARTIATSMKRPFYLLFTEPVVFSFSLWAAFSWGVLYLSFAIVPFLYNANLNMSSRTYIAMMAAAVVATVSGILQEHVLRHPQWRAREGECEPHSDSRFWAFLRRRFPVEAPESRLYFACITSLLLPAGLFVAFLTPDSARPYSLPIGIGFAIWGIFSVYLATFNYLADTYQQYASSALAAQSFCRNVLGGAFPLITGIMFTNLGIKDAGALLGAIATGLSAIPWVLVFFGGRIRARSSFAISLK